MREGEEGAMDKFVHVRRTRISVLFYVTLKFVSYCRGHGHTLRVK